MCDGSSREAGGETEANIVTARVGHKCEGSSREAGGETEANIVTG